MTEKLFFLLPRSMVQVYYMLVELTQRLIGWTTRDG
jgi:hypothetical protein